MNYKNYTIEIIRGRTSAYAVATHLTNGHIIGGDIKDTPKLAVNNVKAKIDAYLKDNSNA